MGKIQAPFTEEQVRKMQAWQNGSRTVTTPSGTVQVPVHPFTCGSHDGCDRSKHYDGILIPRKQGWICPCGKYEQHWCHDYMAE